MNIPYMLRREYALAFYKIEHLIFIKHAAALNIKKISVAMPLGRIVLVRAHFVVSHSIYDKSPLGVTVVSY